MSVSDWSMDVSILVTRIEERMSCYDILSKTWVQVLIFSALFLAWVAYVAYQEWKFLREHKELAHDEQPSHDGLRIHTHDECDVTDDSFHTRHAA